MSFVSRHTSGGEPGEYGQPSKVRRGIDWLLEQHPHLDVVRVDWQLEDNTIRWGLIREWSGGMSGPWVVVYLGQPSGTFEVAPARELLKLAIWKPTGAVYAIGDDGAVGDDPLWTP